jgi:GDP-L-fucose synthase
MLNSSRIYIAGSKGMVGSAISRELNLNNFVNLYETDSKSLNLKNNINVKSYFETIKPEYVFMCAAKVSGIQANINNPANFLIDNLIIQNNLIDISYKNNVKKYLFIGSSCVYPKNCPQPMKEEYILTGKLEPTNEGYAIAKIAGLKLCEFYNKQYGFNAISIMPPNLYGPNDSFDLENSHVLSALVKKFVDAKDNSKLEVILWGSGIAKREFMHVTDLAEAALFMMKNYNSYEFINIGTGEDISILDLSLMISDLVGYKGKILWDTTKPDGMLKKCMDITKMKNLGFIPKISLEEGITEMIHSYKKSKNLIT